MTPNRQDQDTLLTAAEIVFPLIDALRRIDEICGETRDLVYDRLVEAHKNDSRD